MPDGNQGRYFPERPRRFWWIFVWTRLYQTVASERVSRVARPVWLDGKPVCDLQLVDGLGPRAGVRQEGGLPEDPRTHAEYARHAYWG